MSVAIASLILSMLAYEVALGMLLAALAWIGWKGYRVESPTAVRPRMRMGTVIPILAVLIAVSVVKARMQTRVIYHHHPLHLLGRVGEISRHAIVQAVQFNLWAYGLRSSHAHVTWTDVSAGSA